MKLNLQKSRDSDSGFINGAEGAQGPSSAALRPGGPCEAQNAKERTLDYDQTDSI